MAHAEALHHSSVQHHTQETAHHKQEFKHATFPSHQGFLENTADKGVKWGASLGLAAIGTLMWSNPVVGAGLLAYAAGDMMADFIRKLKRRSKEGMFPEHQGPFEQTMDKGVKWVGGAGLVGTGLLAASNPIIGAGLIAYAAGDMAADFAAKVRRGNTPVMAKPSSGHGH